nr:hypothetical protein [Candidatus Sigynarchaeum springense]
MQTMNAINWALIIGITLAAIGTLWYYSNASKATRKPGFDPSSLTGIFLAVPWANMVINRFDPWCLPVTLGTSFPIGVFCIVNVVRGNRARRAGTSAPASPAPSRPGSGTKTNPE